jgi:hypothetical protein
VAKQDKAYWWRTLRRADGQELPPSTIERLAWYERVTQRRRVVHYVMETVIVVTSASGAGAPAGGGGTRPRGILGAVVTALIGARQLFRPEEDWIRFSRTLVALHAEAVAFSVGSLPYDNGVTAAAEIATNTERLVAAETAQWSTLREQHRNKAPEQVG